MKARWVVGAALLLGGTWVGCDDETCRCESEGAGPGGSAGASGEGGASGAPMGAGGAAGLGGGGSGGQGGLVCTTPTTDCGGTCLNVKADDAANCGACGRSCLGTATCAAGACVPEAMTDTAPGKGEVAPYALADDCMYLYWVSPAIKGNVAFSRLRRVANLYWVSPVINKEGGSANDTKMRRVAKASAGGSTTNAFASTIVRARSLAFTEGKLYWGDLGASPSDTNPNLFSGVPGQLVTQLVDGHERRRRRRLPGGPLRRVPAVLR